MRLLLNTKRHAARKASLAIAESVNPAKQPRLTHTHTHTHPTIKHLHSTFLRQEPHSLTHLLTRRQTGNRQAGRPSCVPKCVLTLSSGSEQPSAHSITDMSHSKPRLGNLAFPDPDAMDKKRRKEGTQKKGWHSRATARAT